MTKCFSAFIISILMASGISTPQAQPQEALSSTAELDARQAIQTATNEMDAALKRGDAPSVLQFLSEDFEFGHYQYRKRDAVWMRVALPSQLERVRFTELETTIAGVELKDGQAIARGRLEAFGSVTGQRQRIGRSGDYGAIWVQTKAGWRLRRDDATFGMLVPLNVSTEQPAPIRAPDEKGTTPRVQPFAVLEQPDQGKIDSLVFSPDGAMLATNSSRNGLRFSSAQTGAFLKAMQTPMSINSMTFAPDGTLVTGHSDGKARLWNTRSGALLRELAVSKWSVYSVCVSPDGTLLAADDAGHAQLWEMATGSKLKTLGTAQGNLRDLDFSPDGAVLAFSANQAIELWDIQNEKLVQAIKYEQWAGFLPDGKIIVTVSNGKLRFRVLGNDDLEREVAIPNPNLKKNKTNTIPTLNHIPIISGFFHQPSAIITPDGRIAASIYTDGSIGIWNTQTGTLQRILQGFQSDVMGGDISILAFSPDGETLAVGSRSGETALWRISPPH